jgi:hypothetical protein
MLLCMLMEVAADAVHATWPNTGRLATVITTGAAASPPRKSLRRLFDCGPATSAESGALLAAIATNGSFGDLGSDFIVLT